jgi:hypothetical protein
MTSRKSPQYSRRASAAFLARGVIFLCPPVTKVQFVRLLK